MHIHRLVYLVKHMHALMMQTFLIDKRHPTPTPSLYSDSDLLTIVTPLRIFTLKSRLSLRLMPTDLNQPN